MLLSFSSCAGKKKDLGEAINERDSLPMLETLGVTSFVSDSGITRYRIDTEEWLVFDRKKPSYWSFEKGVYVEKFDSLFRVDASIKADTAYYFDKDKLWELRSKVHIQNIKGEQFDTDLLFWNEKTGKVYSDRFIRIEQTDRIITGYGFESDQQMTDYRIHNISGIFYVDDNEQGSTPQDTIPPILPDTIAILPDTIR
ncbi:LPS export ABC transporter periplasmic protein LptC [Bacteroides sp. 214]|nr:LPS export ABC transporter periplasmic protein LptC [Bacteroides sp. 214]